MSAFRIARVLAFVIIAVLPVTSAAQGRADERLLRRVDSLERRVLELERRLLQLEQPTRDQPAANRASAGNSRDLANWRRLREGMSYDQVRAILGEPERIRGGGVAAWYYPRGGEVGFISGELTSWKEPDR